MHPPLEANVFIQNRLRYTTTISWALGEWIFTDLNGDHRTGRYPNHSNSKLETIATTKKKKIKIKMSHLIAEKWMLNIPSIKSKMPAGHGGICLSQQSAGLSRPRRARQALHSLAVPQLHSRRPETTLLRVYLLSPKVLVHVHIHAYRFTSGAPVSKETLLWRRRALICNCGITWSRDWNFLYFYKGTNDWQDFFLLFWRS